MLGHFFQTLGFYAFVLPAVSFILCALLVLLSKHMPILSGHHYNLAAIQAIHTTPTPRVGGVAIFAVLCGSILFAPVSIAGDYGYFILATSILFAVGLLEDTGTALTPKKRLLACVVASGVTIALLNVWLPRLGVPGFDSLMAYAVIGIPVTLFITAGVANGFNLIDGVNGLASFTAIVSAVTLAMISFHAGYSEMVILNRMLAAGIFGFFLFNFPFGTIFLGDAGAYTIGFVLSWFGITILIGAASASPWAILLTMFWPLADTLLAIFRRRNRKADAMAPDR